MSSVIAVFRVALLRRPTALPATFVSVHLPLAYVEVNRLVVDFSSDASVISSGWPPGPAAASAFVCGP